MSQLDAEAVETAAELGRRTAEVQAIELGTGEDVDSTVIARVVRTDETVQFHDLEQYLLQPRRAWGSAAMHDPASFAAYVTRLDRKELATSLWADDKARTIVAVFNDHDDTAAGWRDHTAKLTVRVDTDWAAWTGKDGALVGQIAFGEFLEEQLHTIGDPPAADLVAIATTLTAKRNLTFESSVRLQSGDVAFEYREETAAKATKAKLDVPERFTIRLSPFTGVAAVDVVARLRYRIGPDGLRIGYKLTRPDIAEREAFDRIVAQVVEDTPEGVPMLLGTAPGALR